MKLIVDMSLSPDWVQCLNMAGHDSTHWSNVGMRNSKDHEIFAWAQANNVVVFTHDLDFGAILAATQAESPSVLQLRTADPTPVVMGRLVLDVLETYAEALNLGALISVDPESTRVRILPIRRTQRRS